METQKTMENWTATPIGTEDMKMLVPKAVTVLGQVKVDVESKKKTGVKYEKIVFSCKHPDREQPIEISDVKYIMKDKIEMRATWFMLDSAGCIQKNSALAALLVAYNAKTLAVLVGKSITTVADERGYLCFRAY